MFEVGEGLEEDYRDALSKLGDELTKASIQKLVFLFPKITRAEASDLQSLRYDDATSEFFRILEGNKYLSLTNVDTLIKALKKVSLLKAAGILEKYKRRNENLINAELQRQYEEDQVKESDSSRSSSTPNSPAKNPQNKAKKKIFISFCLRIEEKVRALTGRIEKHIGKDSCWICETGVQGGDILDGEITQAIDDAEIILCMINKDFADSAECEKEVLLSRQKKKCIIPLLLERVDWPLKKKNGDPSPMQLALAQVLYVNLYKEEKKEAEFRKLITTIEEHLGLRQQDAVADCREGNAAYAEGGNSSQSRPKRPSEGDAGGSIQKKTKAD